MSECQICNSTFRFTWTDTHGVGQCLTCGSPYTIYHYDENNNRMDKPPLIAIADKYIPVIQAYWKKSKRPIPSGFSFFGGYEVASKSDAEAFNEWMDKNNPTEGKE